MNLKFEIDKMVLEYKKPKNNIHTDSDGLFCSFVFTTPEWKHLDKYAIFWDKNDKSFIQYLGKGTKTQCPIPKPILNQLYFFVQVYANEEIKTQKLKVFVYDELSKQHHHKCCKTDVDDFFNKTDKKIDNIIYEDNKLLIYSDNKLINVIDIIDEGLIAKILTNTAPQFIIDEVLSPNSENPVSNKVIYNALQKKPNINLLSDVAFTGDYNDLINKPTALPAAEHTHQASDINDWNDTVDEDLQNLINGLIEEL